MNCREAQECLPDLFDTTPASGVCGLRAHLASCEACAREYAEMQAALANIGPPVRIEASPDFKERIMKKITESEAPARGWRVLVPRFAIAGAVLAALLVAAPFIGSLGEKRSPVVALLAQSVEAMSKLESVHIIARMRTSQRDNFEFIQADYDWAPLEIWKQFGTMPRWRVEKPERVAAMDGTASVLFIKPDHAARGGRRPGFLGWLDVLLDPDRLIETELRIARTKSYPATLAEETRGRGRQLVLTVARKAEGDYGNDWLRHKTVTSSDHTRVYRFDPATKRLQGMQVILHGPAGDVAVFEILEIRYNEAVDPALFTLALPESVIRHVGAEEMAVPAGPLPQSPREAAVMLFDGFAKEDWGRVLAVLPMSEVSPGARHALGGLKVISIGKPFRSGPYPGWFVPYEVRLRSGEVKKHNLAVRNDNPAGRWVQDGGL